MYFRKGISILIFILSWIGAHAAPAFPGNVRTTQPDGSQILLKVHGDEFGGWYTDLSGNAVVKDSDGWWRYAIYEDLKPQSSGYAIGQPTPQSILSSSASIPTSRITSAARELRCKTVRRSLGGLVRQEENEEWPAEIRSIVIFAQFSDVQFIHTQTELDNMLNQKGYSHNGATGSVKDYFEDQFLGKTKFFFDSMPIVTLSKPQEWYGANSSETSSTMKDIRAWEAVAEACRIVLESGVDFSRYDADGDGVVDNVFIIVAGEDEAEGGGENCIWSHHWTVLDGAGQSVNLGGVLLNRYAISSEISRAGGEPDLAGIGKFCHEFCHVLGLMDMYDTDAEVSGLTNGLWGKTSIMDMGIYNNAGRTPPAFDPVDRWTLDKESGLMVEMRNFELSNLSESGHFLRLPTDTPGEEFLVCYRKASGWDSYIGGSGILIYHVNSSDRPAGTDSNGNPLTYENRWMLNLVNAQTGYEGAQIVPCLPISSSSQIDKAFFPQGGANAFTPNTTPAFIYADGGSSPISISEMKILPDGKTATMSVSGPIIIDKQDVFQDAAIILWHTEQSELAASDCNFSWWTEEGDPISVSVTPYGNGNYSYTIENLSPMTEYMATAWYNIGEVHIGYRFKFKTQPIYSDSYPFISLQGCERQENGAFIANTSKLPLRVGNLGEIDRVEWFFNGQRIQAEADGYYTITGAGRLKAIVYYPNGSIDTIIKNISLN